MFSQINLRSVPAEAWAVAASGAGFLAWLGKKLISRQQKPKPKPEYITRAEFHQGLDALRDRITAGYLALADKLDATQRSLADAIASQAAASEQRLDHIETTVARLDERTRNPRPKH